MNKMQRLKLWWYRITGQPTKKMIVYSKEMQKWIKKGIQEQINKEKNNE